MAGSRCGNGWRWPRSTRQAAPRARWRSGGMGANGYNRCGGIPMSENLEAVLEAALRLPLEEQRRLAEQLPAVTNLSDEARSAEEAEWLAIVEETRGTIKGLDRETIIRLAEDEDLCGY